MPMMLLYGIEVEPEFIPEVSYPQEVGVSQSLASALPDDWLRSTSVAWTGGHTSLPAIGNPASKIESIYFAHSQS